MYVHVEMTTPEKLRSKIVILQTARNVCVVNQEFHKVTVRAA